MKNIKFFQTETIGDLLKHLGIAFGIIFFIAIGYFYIYLPNATNHGDVITVPDLTGLPSGKLDSIFGSTELRFEISDTSYSEDHKPLAIIRQFPHAGSVVKPERKIYLSVNRIHPPTVPLPAVIEESVINASSIIRANELRVGKIIYLPSPFRELVLEMQVNGVKIEIGTRVPKGTTVDLIAGDGAGPNDLVVNNLIGLDLKKVRLLLSAINLHEGDIFIPEDVDTTGIAIYVYKQLPKAGDSARVGDPVNLWLKPIDYVVKDSIEVEQP